MDMSSLQKAVRGQIQKATPISSDPAIAKFYAPDFAGQEQDLATAGSLYNTGVQVANQKNAAESSLKKRIKELEAKTNPNNYEIKRKDDGGFDFFDPEGKQIDIATFAENTGQRPVDILKTSENPIDIQYLNDWSNLQDYIDAVVNKDEGKLSAIESQREELKQYRGEGGLHKLLEDFRNYYKRYYVPRTEDPSAWGVRPGRSLVVPNEGAFGGLSGGGIGG